MYFLVILVVGLLGPATVLHAKSPTYCDTFMDPENDAHAINVCSFLTHPDSPFKQCMKKIGYEEVAIMVSQCKVEYCAYGMSRVCKMASQLAGTCKSMHGCPVLAWRTERFCEDDGYGPPPPPSPHCRGPPADDDDAHDACDWITKDNSPFFGGLYHLGFEGMKDAYINCTYKYCHGGMKSVCQYAEYMAKLCKSKYHYDVGQWRDWKSYRFCEKPGTDDDDDNPCADPMMNADALEACSFLQDSSSPYGKCMDDIPWDQAANFMKQCTRLYCYSNTDMLCKLLVHVQGFCSKHGHYIKGLPEFCKGLTIPIPPPSLHCKEDPATDDGAMAACSFLLDITSPLYECLQYFDIKKIKRFYSVCLQIYCDMGYSGVCCYAEHIPEICECQYGMTVPLGLDYCDGTQTTTTTTTTKPVKCVGPPSQDEGAIEACDWLLEPDSPFADCGRHLGLHKVKKFFEICTNLYCKSGIIGVCMFYENVQGICEEKGYPVDGELDVCLPPTSPPTTEPPLCVDNPQREEAAIEACSFILDTDGEFSECFERLGFEKRKKFYKRCVYFYCVEGTDGVCYLADHLVDICVIKFELVIDLADAGLDICLPEPNVTTTTTTTTTEGTTNGPLCVDTPGRDENAIEACDWLLDKYGPYSHCLEKFDIHKIKKFFLICTEIYCKKGLSGVCAFADNLADICEEKFTIIVDDDLDICLPPTKEPTRPPGGPFCVDAPDDDEEAMKACSFILDVDSPYHDCLSRFDLSKIKKFFYICLKVYCEEGMEGVCCFAEHLPVICEVQFDIIINGTLEQCDEGPKFPFCDEEPSKDDDAIEACSFLLDADSIFFNCTESYSLTDIKAFFHRCLLIYCKSGIPGVCELVEIARKKCKEMKDITVVGDIDFCVDTTTTTTTTSTTTTTTTTTTPLEPFCVDEPHHDENAREHCQVILDEHFSECTGWMDLDQVKDYYGRCVVMYCQDGQPGACVVIVELAQHCLVDHDAQIGTDMCV